MLVLAWARTYNLSYVIVNTKGNSYFTKVSKHRNVQTYNSNYIYV